MKTFTKPLMNPVEGGSKLPKWLKSDPDMEQKYYEAHAHEGNLYLLWMESKIMNTRGSFPCVMDEGDGDPLVFVGSSSFVKSGRNMQLMKRWVLFVTPENIVTDFEVRELSGSEFNTIFKEYQSRPATNEAKAPAGETAQIEGK